MIEQLEKLRAAYPAAFARVAGTHSFPVSSKRTRTSSPPHLAAELPTTAAPVGVEGIRSTRVDDVPHNGTARVDARADVSPSARGFSFARYRYRHVALHVMYLGGAYHGFAAQGSSGSIATVESVLFAALRRACLVDDPTRADYSRCGRTDAGVSAAGQVVALRLRSNAKLRVPPEAAATGEAAAAVAAGAWSRPDGLDNDAGEPLPLPFAELDYTAILNGVLPDDVRVVGWADVEPVASCEIPFSARFSCTRRVYRYFFADSGQYDIAAMREAAARLAGTHDFRNFAKFDVVNQQYFVRRVDSVRVIETGSEEDARGAWPVTMPVASTAASGASFAAAPSSAATAPVPRPAFATAAAAGQPRMCFFEVVGQAFLWHQVRCMAAVLFLVGERLESPSVIDFLLDTRGACPSRPQYALAPEQPLCLHHCAYGEDSSGAFGVDEATPSAANEVYDEADDGESGGEAGESAAAAPSRRRPRLYANLHVTRAGLDAASAPLRRRREALLIEAALIGSMLQRLDKISVHAGLPPPPPPAAGGFQGALSGNYRGRRHMPLAKRPREPTLAEKWARLGLEAQRRVATMHPNNTRRMLAEIGNERT